jgi:hypothetical protein
MICLQFRNKVCSFLVPFHTILHLQRFRRIAVISKILFLDLFDVPTLPEMSTFSAGPARIDRLPSHANGMFHQKIFIFTKIE